MLNSSVGIVTIQEPIKIMYNSYMHITRTQLQNHHVSAIVNFEININFQDDDVPGEHKESKFI